MTIHAAKGLEFAVVCVPDLSRPTPAEAGAVAVGPDGEVGLRLRDARGKSAQRAGLRPPRGRGEGGRGGGGRSCRLRRLDASARPPPARRMAGRRRSGELQRVLGQLGIVGAALEPGVATCDVAGVPVRVHVHTAENVAGRRRHAASGGRSPNGPDGPAQPLRCAGPFSPPAARPAAPRPLEPLPAPALHVPRALSYSALALHDRCGFSYYAQRVVGLRPPLRRGRAVARRAARRCAPSRRRGGGRARLRRSRRRRSRHRGGAPRRLGGLLAGGTHARWRERCARAAVRVRRGRRRAQGLARHLRARSADGSLLVADLKTTNLAGREPAAVVESEYALQRSIYALAALRSGAPAAEIAFCFLERPEAPVTRRFAPDGRRLARRRGARGDRAAARVEFAARAGRRTARPVPALDRLCPAPGWHGREAG